MSQSLHQGAERKSSFPIKAEGPTRAFPQNAQSDPRSAGAAFAQAKAVTAELATSAPAATPSSIIPAPARPRPVFNPRIRQGNVFSKAAPAPALPQGQGPKATPFPTHPHSPSSGIFLVENFGAPALHTLSFPKEAHGTPWAAGAAFASAKGVPSDDGQVSPEGTPPPVQNATANRGFQGAPAPLGSSRELTPAPDLENSKMENKTSIYSAHRHETWNLFGSAKHRARRMYMRMKDEDPKNPDLKLLQHASWACRVGAAYKKGFDGLTVGIGYADGEMSWLGTYKCKSPRFCPLCGSIIAMKNAEDVKKGLSNALKKGWSFFFITFTIPHYRTQDSMEIVKGLEKARKIYNQGDDFAKFKKSHGYTGNITRYEETYGLHGWHPHIHEVAIFDHILSEEEYTLVSVFLKNRWEEACKKADLIKENRTESFKKHGFASEYTNVPERVAEYITKIGGWENASKEFKDNAKKEIIENTLDQVKSIQYELSSMNTKAPKVAEGRKPMDIYKGFANGVPGDVALWLEYIKCFEGKTTLGWSRLLKQKLGVKDVDDEDKVHSTEEDSINHIYEIDVDQYNNGVVKNSLWMPILETVETRNFSELQRISDVYGIDFSRPEKAFGDYPAILSIKNSEQRRKKERNREEMRRHDELCARRKEERRIRDEEERIRKREIARLKAEQDAKERARLAKEKAYSVSLLSEEDSHALAVTIECNRRVAQQKKQDERLRRKNG